MKRFFAILLLLAATCASAGEAKNDFSGEWHMDEEKSQKPEWGYTKIMTVTQNDSSLTTSRQVISNFGDYTDVEKFYIDGRKSNNDNDQVKRTTVLSWSEDGKTLTFMTDLNIINMGMDVKVVSICSLAEEGKVLNITSTSESSMGTMEFKSVYHKK